MRGRVVLHALLRSFADLSIHEQRSEHLGDLDSTRDRVACLYEKLRAMSQRLLLGTEYSLVMISRGEVLGARWCSVAWIGVGECVLREEAAVVLVHSARPESGSLCELHPGAVLRLNLGLHGRWRPLQVPSHVTCCRSFGRCRLSLVHRCWCLSRYFEVLN